MTFDSSAGLVDFLEWARERGALNPSTAGASRAAVTQVLEVEGDDFSEVDLRQLDIEELLERFARKKGHKYSPDSISTYQGRFRRAVEMYLEYLNNPAGWKPPKRRGRTPPSPNGRSSKTNEDGRAEEGRTDGQVAGDHQLITYPFPLRSGVTAYFQLPRELPRYEVGRMAQFLNSLAIDPPPALGAGGGR